MRPRFILRKVEWMLVLLDMGRPDEHGLGTVILNKADGLFIVTAIADQCTQGTTPSLFPPARIAAIRTLRCFHAQFGLYRVEKLIRDRCQC
jgi:hypothetical protein